MTYLLVKWSKSHSAITHVEVICLYIYFRRQSVGEKWAQWTWRASRMSLIQSLWKNSNFRTGHWGFRITGTVSIDHLAYQLIRFIFVRNVALTAVHPICLVLLMSRPQQKVYMQVMLVYCPCQCWDQTYALGSLYILHICMYIATICTLYIRTNRRSLR